MSNIFFTADLHFGHSKMLDILDADGNKIRPWDNVEEMNEAIIESWNKTVNDGDKVYIVGDFSMGRRYISSAMRLNGKLILIKGNHDLYPLKDYLPYFHDIRGAFYFQKMNAIVTHIPVHESLFVRYDYNIHGHTHNNVLPDKRYINVCMENTGFKPISLEEIKTKCN